MRFEIGILDVGARLHLTPVAVEHVLPRVDQLARPDHGRLIQVVLRHQLIVQPTGLRAWWIPELRTAC
jgi:hypothetical protein